MGLTGELVGLAGLAAELAGLAMELSGFAVHVDLAVELLVITVEFAASPWSSGNSKWRKFGPRRQ